jgi:hypothetical protein
MDVTRSKLIFFFFFFLSCCKVALVILRSCAERKKMMMMQEWILFSNFCNWWWSSATLLLASWWWWSGLWGLESGPELANCSQARRPLIMSHMCVWLAGWLGWLADWLAFFVLFFSFFFFSSVCNQSLSTQKHKSRKNSAQISHLFLQKKKNFTRRGEKDCSWGGSSAGPELRENACLPTNKRTAMAPASGRGRSDVCSQTGDDPTIKI